LALCVSWFVADVLENHTASVMNTEARNIRSTVGKVLQEISVDCEVQKSWGAHTLNCIKYVVYSTLDDPSSFLKVSTLKSVETFYIIFYLFFLQKHTIFKLCYKL
jgi:hypothetical protein